jgi:uncharacterized protein YgfB (UPF0149 family)
MSQHSNNLSFDQLEEKLDPLKLACGVSRLHGTLCGCLVAGGQLQAENYLRSLLVNKSGENLREGQNALFAMFSMTQSWFSHFGFDFHLLLPDDANNLEERVRAFVDWCQGFLDGFDMTGIEADDIENDEVLEIIQHFDEFSQMEVDEFDYASEEDEKAFIEISEYARMAVLQVLCDLQAEGNESQAPLHH